jgi:hypothetical protein
VGTGDRLRAGARPGFSEWEVRGDARPETRFASAPVSRGWCRGCLRPIAAASVLAPRRAAAAALLDEGVWRRPGCRCSLGRRRPLAPADCGRLLAVELRSLRASPVIRTKAEVANDRQRCLDGRLFTDDRRPSDVADSIVVGCGAANGAVGRGPTLPARHEDPDRHRQRPVPCGEEGRFLRGSPAGTDAGGTRHGRRLGARPEYQPTRRATTLWVGFERSAARSRTHLKTYWR